MKKIQAASLQKVADASSLVTAAHKLDTSGQYVKSPYERSVITNACFLNVFIALEDFFEQSFEHYAMGKMSTAKWRPSKYARPPSAAHAQQMFIGSQPFMDWSTPGKVVRLAELYFANGEPFAGTIKSSIAQLQNMKKVRNATAHLSLTTQASLDAVFSNWTGKPAVGVSPYRMLLATKSSGIDSFFGVSTQTVTVIINQIAAHS